MIAAAAWMQLVVAVVAQKPSAVEQMDLSASSKTQHKIHNRTQDIIMALLISYYYKLNTLICRKLYNTAYFTYTAHHLFLMRLPRTVSVSLFSLCTPSRTTRLPLRAASTSAEDRQCVFPFSSVLYQHVIHIHQHIRKH